LLPVSSGNAYLAQNAINPIVGKPLFSVYSYPWKGLDSVNGNPRGMFNGKVSEDWQTIQASTRLNDMDYNGPTQPVVFGSLRNTFIWHYFSVSANISFKTGYYFRRPSIRYSDLLNLWTGSSDYGRRWQNPGDEKKTNIPSFSDSADRDNFYTNSSVLVTRGDQVRLEDISLSYDLDKGRWKNMPFQQVRLYAYIANLGLLWAANKQGIDPYYVNVPKDGRRFSLGATLHF
jgi:hypothetical protein